MELSDFNEQGSLYWVRKRSFPIENNNRQYFYVYTKIKIDKIENGEILSWIKIKNGNKNLWRISKEEIQSNKEDNALVPDYLYESIKNQDSVFPSHLNHKQYLSYIMKTTGNSKIDEMIKKTEYSFKELHDLFLNRVKNRLNINKN